MTLTARVTAYHKRTVVLNSTRQLTAFVMHGANIVWIFSQYFFIIDVLIGAIGELRPPTLSAATYKQS